MKRNLGDLDEFKLAEREELDVSELSNPPPGRDLPPPYYQQAPKNVPIGQNVPKFGALVQSTFDTRPINGQDWAASFSIGLTNSTGGQNNFGLYTISFKNFAPGFVAILRQFSVQMRGIVTNQPVSEGEFALAFIVNGSAVPFVTGPGTVTNTDGVQLPADQMRVFCQLINFPTHVIVPEGGTLGVQISNPIPIANDQEVKIHTELYGNVLQSRGLPANFEVGTL